MLALLFCLISLGRRTYFYFVGKLLSDMERQPSSFLPNEDAVPVEPRNDRETDQEAEDDEVLDDSIPPAEGPSTTKPRHNSVVDSAGIPDHFLMTDKSTLQRRRIASAKEYSSSKETSPDSVFSSSSDVYEPALKSRVGDTVDAHTASNGGYACKVESKPPVPVPVHIDAHYYNMNHKQRGRCVIFNHEEFENDFDSRVGSTTDALRIEKTFKALGFNVEIHDNLYYSDVLAKIFELSEEDHTDNDCICIFVLTHGISNDLIWAKDAAYKSDSIWKPFTADKCTTLAGKPKLFFFQACRGDQLDAGLTVARRSLDRSETDSAVASYKIPTHADFLIAYSTVQGFLSWRNPEQGTWYVQCLCDVLDEYWSTKDLVSMLTIAARRIATEYSSYDDVNPAKHDQKQVPSMTSMLIRDVHFTPKTEKRAVESMK